MNVIQDERGFLDVYLLGIFFIFATILLAILLATAAGARKNAVASYSWFTEAADYAAHTAAMNGLTTANNENAPYVEQYFNDSFASITQTSNSGNEFEPQGGSPLQGNIQITGFTPYGAGSVLPNGASAKADGYWISITVPVLSANLPFIGNQNVNVPMGYFAEL
jgi:hypothetical protein